MLQTASKNKAEDAEARRSSKNQQKLKHNAALFESNLFKILKKNI